MDEWEGYYEENDDNAEEIYEAIEELRGTIGRGDCIFCGAKNAMVYDGEVCFICNECGLSCHEDTYYAWAAGYDIETTD